MEIKKISDYTVFSDKSLTKRVLYAGPQALSFVLNLKAGQVLPPHKHEKSTLVLLVLSGKGEIRINDEGGTLEKGSFVMAGGEDTFEIPKVAEDLSLYVTISPNPSDQLYSKEFG